MSKTLTAVRQQLLLARSLIARPSVELLNPLSSELGDLGQLLQRMRQLEAKHGRSTAPEQDAPEVTRALYDLERSLYEAPVTLADARAFWINLYNLLTLHDLFHARVRRTVLEIPGFTKRFAYRVSELDFSLDDIEHGVLRENRALNGRPHFAPNDPKLNFTLPLDPRVHFALNCGAVSCPAIHTYDGANLDHQLEAAMRNYLSDARVVHGRVVLPRIFQWYARDFGSGPRVALDFVRRYRTDLPKFAPVVFDEYDWRLPTSK